MAPTPTQLTLEEIRRLKAAMGKVPNSGMSELSKISRRENLTVDDLIEWLGALTGVMHQEFQREEATNLRMRQMEALLRAARDWHSFLERRDPNTGEPIAPENDIV